jgi:sporulation protein YlmC with PRC-barrel domain
VVVIGELRNMARPRLEEALGWIGLRVDDVYGIEIGELADVWTDQRTGEARWLLIHGAHLRVRRVVVPFADASGGPGEVWVPYERRTVCDAPAVASDDTPDDDLDARLRAHFARARGEADAPASLSRPRWSAEHSHRLG